MVRQFTLEYWKDGGMLVGCLAEVPGVFSQGATLDELKDNVRDAYRMMVNAGREERANAQRTEITVHSSGN